jgi:hypothetical protein
LINLRYLTFGYEFNKPLANSLDKLTNLNQITFGEYFNQPLANSLDKLTNLSQIIFGLDFNQPLANSFDKLINLTIIDFDDKFNQPLGNSFNKLINLKSLYFRYSFNQPLSNSLDNLINLTHLALGHDFNQELYLPPNIKILTLECDNQYIYDTLPNSIEQLNLDFDHNCDLTLDNFPSSIKIIKFYEKNFYCKSLNNLPKYVEILQLPFKYNVQIKNIPIGLKKIICPEEYEFIDDFIGLGVEIEIYE